METLEIDLLPNWCNQWPELLIRFNDTVIFQNLIKEKQTVKLSLHSKNQNNTLNIGLNNKRFGENGIYDTVLNEDNNIVNDLFLEIVDVKIDSISIKQALINKNYQTKQDDTTSEIYSDGQMFYNGYFLFTYNLPVINSIIEHKYKISNSKKTKTHYSDTDNVFNYEQDLKLIQEIEEILNETKKFDS
jgi:hypothetical protein